MHDSGHFIRYETCFASGSPRISAATTARLAFPDIGLSLLDGIEESPYDFLPEYRPEYAPEQLMDYDVIISLKPRVTRAIVGRRLAPVRHRPLRRGL